MCVSRVLIRIWTYTYTYKRVNVFVMEKKKRRDVTSLSATGKKAAVKFKVRNLLLPVVETRAGVKAPPSKSLLESSSFHRLPSFHATFLFLVFVIVVVVMVAKA